MASSKQVCNVCGYEYVPAEENNVAFDALPADWTCPVCGADKGEFGPA
jgi:rubredoxin